MLLLALLPLAVSGQNVSWRFFDHYSKAEGFTSVQIERKMMRMMSCQAAEKGDDKLAELLDGIQYIRIVSVDGGDEEQFLSQALELVDNEKSDFQLVMSTSEGGQTTRFYLREADYSLDSELLMLTWGEKETVAVNIYGLFDLKQVSRLSGIRPKR